MIRVPILNYYQTQYGAEFEYPQFHNGFEEVPMPTNSKYFAGDVVIVTEGGVQCVGVVLGMIDNVKEVLRTDVSGNVSFSCIRPVKTMKELRLYKNFDVNVDVIVNCIVSIKRNAKINKYLATLK